MKLFSETMIIFTSGSTTYIWIIINQQQNKNNFLKKMQHISQKKIIMSTLEASERCFLYEDTSLTVSDFKIHKYQ